MTREIESGAPPITPCNGGLSAFQPCWLAEPHTDEVVIRGRLAITWTYPQNLQLTLRTGGSARKIDADGVMPEVRLARGRQGGGAPQLFPGAVEHYGDHRAVIDAGGSRHVDGRADRATAVRAVDDDLEAVGNRCGDRCNL